MTVAEELSQGTRELLTDITGEEELDEAVKTTLKETIQHRLQEVRKKIEEFENKYGTSFKEFQNKWRNDEIEDKHSYNVEKDYLEWEALETRKEKLVEASKWTG